MRDDTKNGYVADYISVKEKERVSGKVFNQRFVNSCLANSPSVYIQLFRERLSEKMCTRQSRKAIWDMINTLFLTTVAVEYTFAAFL